MYVYVCMYVQVVEEKRRLYSSVQKRDLQLDERNQSRYEVAAEAKGFPDTITEDSVEQEYEDDEDKKVEQEQTRRPPSHRGLRYASTAASDATADRGSLDSRARDLPEGRTTGYPIRSSSSSSATAQWRRPQYHQQPPEHHEHDEYEEEGDGNGNDNDDDESGFDSLTRSLRASTSKESKTVAHQLKDELTTLDVEIGRYPPAQYSIHTYLNVTPSPLI